MGKKGTMSLKGKQIRKEDNKKAIKEAKKPVKPVDVKKSVEEEEVEDESEIESEIGEDDEIESESDERESDSDGDSDENSDSDDDIPKKKKRKTDDGSASFASAVTSIVASKLKAYDRTAPIMARNKVVMKKLESDKLEAQAKRALLAEKKLLYDKHRVKNLLPTDENVREILEHEKKLKKTAQKGVVKLFNAILATQVKTTQAISQEKVGEVKKEELFNEMSKEKFLDMVQSAGNE